MTDPGIIALGIAGIGCIQAVAVATIIAWFNKKHEETQTAFKQTNAAIEVVRKDVNGQTEKLLQVDGDAREAKGNLQGHAEAAAAAVDKETRR